jgi:hypothetical protein
MIGVSFGAPTEFRYRGKMIEGDLPTWKPERVSNALQQDDLYVELTPTTSTSRSRATS